MSKPKPVSPVPTTTGEPPPAAPAVPVTPPAPAPAETAATPPPPAAPDPLQQQTALAAENWDKYLRALADLDNYRKRAAREREEMARAAREQVILAMLGGLDNLERAAAAAAQAGTAGTSLLAGLEQVRAQFLRALAEFGLAEVPSEPGAKFDPNLHEAVSEAPHADHPEGMIVQQLQRGYKLGDRLLRPARVVVSNGKPGAS